MLVIEYFHAQASIRKIISVSQMIVLYDCKLNNIVATRFYNAHYLRFVCARCACSSRKCQTVLECTVCMHGDWRHDLPSFYYVVTKPLYFCRICFTIEISKHTQSYFARKTRGLNMKIYINYKA